MNKLQLPHDSKLRHPEFLFGVATSSYQIEGGAREGGRSPSIWDTFCNKPGAVDNADNGDVACDHYHLWKQDIEMIQGLGVGAYRLSMAWSRIVPQEGEVNQAGLKFYEKIIDECHARGLKVFVTLYHWDLPQYLEDEGGWLNRQTAYKFAEYANTVSAHFGDKIDSYATLNEPFCSAYLGYRWGVHAPGLKGEREGFLSAHHLMLGHGLAIPYMRKNAPNAMHGCVFNATPAYPHGDADTGAAEYVDAEGYHWFMDPVLKGEYPKLVLERQSQYLPEFSRDDLDIIRTDLDFIGINFYTRCVVRYDEHGEIKTVPQPEQEHTFIDWEIYPQGLTDLLLRLNQRYPNLPPLYITENGAANDDQCVAGEVNDEQRVRYFQLHLEAVDLAVKAGVDIRGYFAWSLMDNFEWAYGYKQRFGIVYVDYRTQKRTLKASAIAYRDMLLARVEEGDNGGS